MKHSSTFILPRLFKSSARQRRIFDSVSSSTHCWKRRWQVWYEGNRSGKSFQRAPERKIHKIPFSTARSSQRGRPRPSSRGCTVGSSGSIKAHCSSCSSSRLGITVSRWLPGKTVFHIKRLFGIFETASSMASGFRRIFAKHKTKHGFPLVPGGGGLSLKILVSV